MTVTLMLTDPDTWLEGQVELEPDHPVLWGNRTPIRGVEHLGILMSGLAEGRHGVVDGGPSRQHRWGQTMRVEGRWFVEVHDGSADDYARRVFRGEPGEYPLRPDFVGNLWHHNPEVLAVELFAHFAAAQVLWAWVHTGLPEGLSRTLRHFSAETRQRIGMGDL